MQLGDAAGRLGADEGPGIPDEERTHVFEGFHRGPAQQAHGAGLGLAIARQIVESHEGRLVLADRNGPGSTFVVWLPERAVSGAPERGPVPPSSPLGERLAGSGRS